MQLWELEGDTEKIQECFRDDYGVFLGSMLFTLALHRLKKEYAGKKGWRTAKYLGKTDDAYELQSGIRQGTIAIYTAPDGVMWYRASNDTMKAYAKYREEVNDMSWSGGRLVHCASNWRERSPNEMLADIAHEAL